MTKDSRINAFGHRHPCLQSLLGVKILMFIHFCFWFFNKVILLEHNNKGLLLKQNL